MTTTKPPARRHTRASESKRKDALDEGIRIKIDGEVYAITAGDLTALDARALRNEVGVSFPRLMQQAAEDFDIDTLAALIWLARRTAGERTLRYEDVAAEIGYDDLEGLDLDPDEDEQPEVDAPGN